VSSGDVSTTQSVDVNSLAASEVKGQDCVPCSKQPIYRPVDPSPTEQVKHGAFRCEMCQKATVGADWEDLWADDGTSLHCLCKDCFAKSSPSEKEAALNAFINRSDPSMKNNPSIRSAIKLVSRR